MKKAGILSLFLMQWMMLGCLKSESMQTLPAGQPGLYTEVVASEPAILLEPVVAPKTHVPLRKKIGRCAYGIFTGALPGAFAGTALGRGINKVVKKGNWPIFPTVISFAAFGAFYGCIKRLID